MIYSHICMDNQTQGLMGVIDKPHVGDQPHAIQVKSSSHNIFLSIGLFWEILFISHRHTLWHSHFHATGYTFQCMINHEQILFFHLRVMESKIDNSPKETNSMKTKNKHFTVFLSFMCLKGAAKCERQSTNHPPKAITTSKHLSNSILKLQRCYH